MKIRPYKTEDLAQLVVMAQDHNLLLPPDGMINIAEASDGTIRGMMLIRMILMIEPFICINPLIGKKLFDETLDQLKEVMKDHNIIRCFAKPEHVDLYKKLGFYEIFNDYKIMERNL